MKRTSTKTPSASRTPPIQGLAISEEMLLSSTAPQKAPSAPGMASRRTVRQSTLPKRQCAKPEAAVVPSSARWTAADAEAGLYPAASTSVVDVTP